MTFTPLPGSYPYWVGSMLATLRIVVRDTGNDVAAQTLRQFRDSDLGTDADRMTINAALTAGGKEL